jgi:hypothetical protein
MRKPSSNDSGFSAVELILVIVIVVLIGVGGLLVYRDHKTTPTSVATKSIKSTITTPKATTPVTTPSTTTVVKIPQLGIEVTVPNSIKDLTYAYRTSTTGFGNNEQLLIADLSTASLTALDSNCSASNQTAFGAISEANGTYPADPSDQANVGQLIKQFPNFYVTWSSESQTSCTADGNTAANTLLASQKQIVNSTLPNSSSVQLVN